MLKLGSMSRINDFENIETSIDSSIRAKNSKAIVAEGDSLELLKKLPAQSISLILTDPPYHSTKKGNIRGDTDFKEDAHYVQWMEQFMREWKRVLRPNGSILCFCSPAMAARLEVAFEKQFNILSQIVWTKPNDPGFDGWKQKMKKESLRQWYAHTERIIFAEPAHGNNLHRSYFGNLLRKKRQQAELSGHQLTELTGAYGNVNHGGAVSNWEAGRNVPSHEQYAKICDALIGTGKVTSMPEYEDAIRPFKTDANREFTDVWNFPSVRPFRGKHPAEKPIALLEHAIEAATYPGDIVLDCFSGSGNTGLAAIKCGRKAVLMELDPVWAERSSLVVEVSDNAKDVHISFDRPIVQRTQVAQASLFV